MIHSFAEYVAVACQARTRCANVMTYLRYFCVSPIIIVINVGTSARLFLLATCYSLLITHYLLLITHYFNNVPLSHIN